jgi:hypothetical protein
VAPELEGSSSHTQQPANGPYPEPNGYICISSIFIALMMEAVCTTETSVYYNETSGAISQKALIFVLDAVRT